MKRINLHLSESIVYLVVGVDILDEPWLKEFLHKHSNDLLFLPRSIMVFFRDSQIEDKESFFEALHRAYSEQNEATDRFVLRSLMWYINYPVKIEIEWQSRDEKAVDVAIRASRSGRIKIITKPSYWLVNAFYLSQFTAFVTASNEKFLEIDVTHPRALRRLNHILLRNKILFFSLKFDFDVSFIENLINFYRPTKSLLEENRRYYEVLECEVNDPPERLKANYKKLAKTYHPDNVFNKDRGTIIEYTRKFQLLQEAYRAIIAS